MANSIVGLLQLGNEVGFIGKVNDDDFGKKYLKGLEKEKVKYCYDIKSEKEPTGTCLILIAQTLKEQCTFLGTAGKINEKDINEKIVKQVKLPFLRDTCGIKVIHKKHLIKQLIILSKLPCLFLIYFVLKRHKAHFLDLVQNKLNITFANEQEISALIEAKNFKDVVTFAKEIKKLIVITRGKNGAIAY